ncbi:MAG: integrase DNA-binding domain-containing protein [Lachnospiraceae bacterium]|nr:integrase DNA-binding domain-containing protein [Lachnospiraceae bacterium]
MKFSDVKISLDMIQWTCHIKALSITERSLTMSEKRKDNKGRILRTGESQRNHRRVPRSPIYQGLKAYERINPR